MYTLIGTFAAVTLLQTPVAPVAPPQLPVAALAAAAAQLAAAESRVAAVPAPALAAQASALAAADARLAAAVAWPAAIADVPPALRTVAPAPWVQGDPADSVYRAARRLLNDGHYDDAAKAFANLIRRYPRSAYVPDAYYWQAFALYRTGAPDALRQARATLELQRQRYPHASTAGDGAALYARVQGELARQGDADAAVWVQAHADSAAHPALAAGDTGASGCASDDDDPRIMALNALLQTDADQAMPILQKVLARRDPCSAELRRRALFIVSQKRTPETAQILLGVARSDPDSDVRGQAVFWLSQIPSDATVDLLDSIARSSTDPELQQKAIFGLSQQKSPRARAALRDFVERRGTDPDVRRQAIMWLAQSHDPESLRYLEGIYSSLDDDELRQAVLMAVAQSQAAGAGDWLLARALDSTASDDVRRQAIFWAGQSGAISAAQLGRLYTRTTNGELKGQIVFALSRQHDSAAVTELIGIAKRETDQDLKRQVIFWLGQSHDARAVGYLKQLLEQ